MKYCVGCGFVGKPKLIIPGTLSMEIVLWLLLILPGIIYSLWRRLGSHQGCAKCGKKHIVPTDSPVAQAAFGRMSPPSSRSAWVCMVCGDPIFHEGGFCERCEALATRATEAAVHLQV